MKRLTAVLAVVLLACTGVYASISIEWFSYGGNVLQSDGLTPLPVGSIWQLIWSSNSTLTALSPGDPLTPGSRGSVS